MFKFKIAACLMLLVFSWLMQACSAVDRSVAEEALVNAESGLASAYVAVAEAEGAGANVSSLLTKLNVAGRFLAKAHNCYRTGDFNGAVDYANLSVESVKSIVREAEELKALAADEYKERCFQTEAAFVLAVVLIVVGSITGWLFFKKRYLEKALRMRPEVVESES